MSFSFNSVSSWQVVAVLAALRSRFGFSSLSLTGKRTGSRLKGISN